VTRGLFSGRPDAAGETFRRNGPSLRSGCLGPSRGRASPFRLSLMSVGSRDVAEKGNVSRTGEQAAKASTGRLGNDYRCFCCRRASMRFRVFVRREYRRDNLRMNRKSAMIINEPVQRIASPGAGAAWRGKMLLKEIRGEAQRERVPRKRIAREKGAVASPNTATGRSFGPPRTSWMRETHRESSADDTREPAKRISRRCKKRKKRKKRRKKGEEGKKEGRRKES